MGATGGDRPRLGAVRVGEQGVLTAGPWGRQGARRRRGAGLVWWGDASRLRKGRRKRGRLGDGRRGEQGLPHHHADALGELALPHEADLALRGVDVDVDPVAFEREGEHAHGEPRARYVIAEGGADGLGERPGRDRASVDREVESARGGGGGRGPTEGADEATSRYLPVHLERLAEHR